MVLSTRVSLQWGSEEPEELTSTYVFTTPKNHFVDVRIYKHEYPHIQNGDPADFSQIFQWVIVGEEEELAGTNKIKFNHSINSQEILKSIASRVPLSECRSAPDVGEFWPIEGSEDRKETGSMVNPDTGVDTSYVEIWRSLSPNFHSDNSEVREGHDSRSDRDSSSVVAMTFDTNADALVGRVVRLGRWVQGVIYDESDPVHPLSVMRSYLGEAGEWIPTIKYGKHTFTEAYKTGDADLNWKRIE